MWSLNISKSKTKKLQDLYIFCWLVMGGKQNILIISFSEMYAAAICCKQPFILWQDVPNWPFNMWQKSFRMVSRMCCSAYHNMSVCCNICHNICFCSNDQSSISVAMATLASFCVWYYRYHKIRILPWSYLLSYNQNLAMSSQHNCLLLQLL